MREESHVLPKCLVLIFLLGTVPLIYGAIGAAVDFNSGGGAGNIGVQITNNATANTLLAVGIDIVDSTDADRVISSCRFISGAGATTQSLTMAASLDDLSANRATHLYYLVAPASGAGYVTNVYAGTVTLSSMWAATWNGVAQTSTIGATNYRPTFTATTGVTNTITATGETSLICDNIYKFTTNGTESAAADLTVLVNASVGTTYHHGAAYSNIVTSGAKSFIWSWPGTNIQVIGVIAEFNEAAAVTTTNLTLPNQSDLRLLGVGQ